MHKLSGLFPRVAKDAKDTGSVGIQDKTSIEESRPERIGIDLVSWLYGDIFGETRLRTSPSPPTGT